MKNIAAVSALHLTRVHLVQLVLWHGCADDALPCAHDGPDVLHIALGCLTFVGLGLLLLLGAVGLTLWEPAAFGSGLPRLKAFLNGCYVDILRPKTLIAKVLGTTLVVSSGIPLGREGPMVHVGAIVASVSRGGRGS